MEDFSIIDEKDIIDIIKEISSFSELIKKILSDNRSPLFENKMKSFEKFFTQRSLDLEKEKRILEEKIETSSIENVPEELLKELESVETQIGEVTNCLDGIYKSQKSYSDEKGLTDTSRETIKKNLNPTLKYLESNNFKVKSKKSSQVAIELRKFLGLKKEEEKGPTLHKWIKTDGEFLLDNSLKTMAHNNKKGQSYSDDGLKNHLEYFEKMKSEINNSSEMSLEDKDKYKEHLNKTTNSLKKIVLFQDKLKESNAIVITQKNKDWIMEAPGIEQNGTDYKREQLAEFLIECGKNSSSEATQSDKGIDSSSWGKGFNDTVDIINTHYLDNNNNEDLSEFLSTCAKYGASESDLINKGADFLSWEKGSNDLIEMIKEEHLGIEEEEISKSSSEEEHEEHEEHEMKISK
ncbi:MAG: hypothetical protein HRT88_20540 [Lentisphaeraceae bacterium]|nr:hypothetical protein [Lentisphaeraceae bacterium]